MRRFGDRIYSHKSLFLGSVLCAVLCAPLFAKDKAPELKPADGGAPLNTGPMEFPMPGEAPQLGKMPTDDGTLAKIRKKYFYLGELTWRGGILLNQESSDWADTRKTSIEEDLFRQVSASNYSRNVPVSAAVNSTLNYMVGIEGLLGVNIDSLPGFKNAKWARGKKFLRVGFHAYMAPYFKQTAQTIAGPFSYYDPGTVCGNCAQTRTYAGRVKVDENLLTVAPGMSFFYWYEQGFWGQRIMPYAGFEIGLSIVYGKRKYTMETQPYATTLSGDSVSYSLETNLQESIINDLGFRIMPALGIEFHIQRGHYIDFRVGYQFQNYNVTLNRRGSLTETKTTNGNFAVTYSEDFLNKTREAKLSQSGIVILLGYTAGLF